jgi:hypothetical protein
MNAAAQLVGQQLIDSAVTLQAASPGEGRRDDAHAEVGFPRSVKRLLPTAFGVVMARVKMAFVENLKPFRRQGGRQFFGYAGLNGHRIGIPLSSKQCSNR